MMELFQPIVVWHWFALAALLLIIEVLMGTGFLLGVAVASSAVGLVLLFIELSNAYQLGLFAIFSLITTFSWRLYLQKNPPKTHRLTLNRRGHQYIGRVFTLSMPVVNGMGVVHVDDTIWRVRCVDVPAQTKVKIVGVDGVILLADPYEGKV